MVLTRKRLRTILRAWRVNIPNELEHELIAEYGKPVIADNGRVFEYTEQDICEQLRKRLLNVQEVSDRPLTIEQ